MCRLLVLLVVEVLPRPGLVEICGATGLSSGQAGSALAELKKDLLIVCLPGDSPSDGCPRRQLFLTTVGGREEAVRLAAALRRSVY